MAKPKDKQPWFKFYPSDWAGDRKLRMCSIAARGLWAELLCVMHEADPYGHLVTDGRSVTNRQIASLAGIPLAECGKLMAELESAGVYSRTDDKTIFSRRMVRDKAKAEQDRKNGKGGGNPIITGEDNRGVNPPDKGEDKAQKPKPSSRVQNPEAAADARGLDEMGLKQESLLKAAFIAECATRPNSPDMSIIKTWLLDGITVGTISATVPPILRRKADMVSLVYCDAAVREAHAKAPPTSELQVVSRQVFIIEGTMEWACWERHLRETTGRGSPVTDNRDEHNRLRRGWFRPSTVPPGYDEATGERIAPSEAEDAA